MKCNSSDPSSNGQIRNASYLLGLFAFLLERSLRSFDLLDFVNEAVLDFVANQLDSWSVSTIFETSLGKLHDWVFLSDSSLKIINVIFETGNLLLGLEKQTKTII